MMRRKNKSPLVACLQILNVVIFGGIYLYVQSKPKAFCKNKWTLGCPDNYFSENYKDSRNKFLFYSKKIESSLIYNIPIYNDINDNNETLYTDITILNHNSLSNKMIIHMSGTHGAEGFAGSAIQCGILDFIYNYTQNNNGDDLILNNHLFNPKSFNDEYPINNYDILNMDTCTDNECNNDKPIMIFIHAINPYGFKYGVRSNENNVDLNRNLKTKTEWETYVENEKNDKFKYKKLMNFWNPKHYVSQYIKYTSFIPNKLTKYLDMLYFHITYWDYFPQIAFYLTFITTKLEATTAYLIGTTQNKHYTQYVGQPFIREKSHLALINFFKDIVETKPQWKQQINSISVIDVHTGLNEYGDDTFITFDNETKDTLSKLFPRRNTKGQIQNFRADTASLNGAYLYVNGATDGYLQILKDTLDNQDIHFTFFAQEFGTYNSLFVSQASRYRTNIIYEYETNKDTLTKDEQERFQTFIHKARESEKNVFYVQEFPWKKRFVYCVLFISEYI